MDPDFEGLFDQEPPGLGKLVVPPTVVGCGRSNGELIRLFAYDTTKELCLELERPRERKIQGGSCWGNDESWRDACNRASCVTILPADLDFSLHYEHVTVTGFVPPGTGRVEVTIGRGGGKWFPTVAASLTDPEQLAALHLSKPFVFYGVVLPRCVSSQPVSVRAQDKSGAVIARRRARSPLPCAISPLPD